MPLYHFSEEPDIRIFEPRIAPSSTVQEPVVWAIDDWHQAMYFFPRDCPRACFWPGALTTPEDRERLVGPAGARMVIAIESRWLGRLRSTTLYRYAMPEATFSQVSDGSGHWISRQSVVPLAVETLPDLLGAIIDAGVELRLMPSLVELWKTVAQSSLQFSGTRLRNAAGWSAIDWDAIPLGIYAAAPNR